MKTIQIHLGIACLCALSATAIAQEGPLDGRRVAVDPNNAVIEGRLLLPTGRAADINVKVVLSELNRPLFTVFTNKQGEFQFHNLRAGEYYVQVSFDEKVYEPVVQRLRLNRGQIFELNITLRRKEEIISRHTGPRTISASEFDPSVPAAARKEYDQGVKLAGKGDRQRAIGHLQRAIEIYPDFIIAHNDLGAQYLKLKQFDQAAEQFQLALEKNPKYFNSIFNLALVMTERKDYAEAMVMLNRAIAVDNTRPAAHFWLGIASLNIGDLSGAERALSKALIMDSANFTAAHYYLGLVHLKSTNQSEAIRSLKAYLEEAPRGEFVEEARRSLKELSKVPPPSKP